AARSLRPMSVFPRERRKFNYEAATIAGRRGKPIFSPPARRRVILGDERTAARPRSIRPDPLPHHRNATPKADEPRPPASASCLRWWRCSLGRETKGLLLGEPVPSHVTA